MLFLSQQSAPWLIAIALEVGGVRVLLPLHPLPPLTPDSC